MSKLLRHRNGWTIPVEGLHWGKGRDGMVDVRTRIEDLPDDMRESYEDRYYPIIRDSHVAGEGPLHPTDWEEATSGTIMLKMSQSAVDWVV